MNRVVKEANRTVDECADFKNSIKDCLQVLQKACVEKPRRGDSAAHIAEKLKNEIKVAEKAQNEDTEKVSRTAAKSMPNNRTDVSEIFAKSRQALENIMQHQRRSKEILDRVCQRRAELLQLAAKANAATDEDINMSQVDDGVNLVDDMEDAAEDEAAITHHSEC